MTIRFRCECGKELRVEDRLAGRQGTCKVCGRTLVIPSVAAPANEPATAPGVRGEGTVKATGPPVTAVTGKAKPSTIAIVVACTCGKQFKVKDELAGKRGKCAACGRVLTVPTLAPSVDRERASPSPLRACPTCQKALQPNAVICLNCGLDLRTGKQSPHAKSSAPAAPSKPSAKAPEWVEAQKIKGLFQTDSPPLALSRPIRVADNSSPVTSDEQQPCPAASPLPVLVECISPQPVVIPPQPASAPSFTEQQLLDLLKTFPTDGVYFHPDIPPKKGANAARVTGLPASEPMLALVDCTVMGSAKNCLVFGFEGVYYRNGWEGKAPGKGAVPYSGFGTLDFRVEGWHEVYLGPKDFVNMAGARCSKPRLVEILLAVKRLVAPQAAGGPPLPEPTAGTGSSNCPHCQSSLIDRKSEFKSSTVGHFVGQALFGIVGNVIAGAALGRTIEKCECRSCRYKWVNEKPSD